MAGRKPTFQQSEAQRFFRAARKEGFTVASMVEHPDGRREFKVAISDDMPIEPHNTFDIALQKQGL